MKLSLIPLAFLTACAIPIEVAETSSSTGGDAPELTELTDAGAMPAIEVPPPSPTDAGEAVTCWDPEGTAIPHPPGTPVACGLCCPTWMPCVCVLGADTSPDGGTLVSCQATPACS